MSLASLLPIGGAALGVVAGRAISGLSSGLATGLAFQSALAGANPNAGKKESDTVVTDSSAAVNLEELVPKFAAVLRDRMRQSGVNPSIPFTLKDDGTGGILVDGEHPDRSTIEELFRGDSELMAQFHEIAAAATSRRQASPGVEGRFGEFRLSLDAGSAAIYFE